MTFDFHIADSPCRGAYRIDAGNVQVLAISNVGTAGYHFPVRLDRDGLDQVAALILESLPAVRKAPELVS